MTAANRDPAFGGAGGGGPATFPPVGTVTDLNVVGNFYERGGLPWSDVKACGAIGDGITDDTVAFQTAIGIVTAQGGGTVFIPPGNYRITATLEPKAAMLEGTAGVPRVPSAEVTQLFHDFNGDFIRWPSSGNLGAWGGGLKNLLLMNKAGRTGTAIKLVAAASDAVGPSRCFFENVYVSTQDGTSQGFTRDVWIDGTLATIGCRQNFFNNCQFFGCETVGETVRVDHDAAAFFSNCSIYRAPSLQRQGLKVMSAFTANTFWIGGSSEDIYSEAAPAGQAGLTFLGSCEGNVDFSTGERNAAYLSYLNGTANTGAKNICVHPGNQGGAIVTTQFTAPVTVSGASEAAATTIVTAPALVFDGVTQIGLEFFAPAVTTGAADLCLLYLYDGATSLGIIGFVGFANAINVPVLLKRYVSPSAGSHTFSIRGSRTTNNATIQAGLGTSGLYSPGHLRITR